VTIMQLMAGCHNSWKEISFHLDELQISALFEMILQHSFEYMQFIRTHIPQPQPQKSILMDEFAVYLEDRRRTTIDSIEFMR